MVDSRTILSRIQYASAKELGIILDDFNRESYQANDWNSLSVKASYSTVLLMIEDAWNQCKQFIDYGNETMTVVDCATGEQRVMNVRQALTNLKIAKEFFDNPPVIDNPNTERITVDPERLVSLDKPVYTIEEIETLLNISESTMRRWIKQRWISFTQLDGSDKKFIQKEHLMEFLNNPKIFYPSTK